MIARYGLYVAPPPGHPLWEFGSSAIGYDAVTGLDLPVPTDWPFDPEGWRLWTAEPRRYGFHGTLKAPFHLAEGRSEAALLDAVRDFAASRTPVVVPRLAVRALGAFLALVPAEPAPALSRLADDIVRELDPFRAPLSAADRARRLAASLSPRQLRHLDAWGYPHVLEDFRFHMTLTGPLPLDERDGVVEALAALYAAVAPGLAVDAVTVFRQDGRDARFRIVERCAFA